MMNDIEEMTVGYCTLLRIRVGEHEISASLVHGAGYTTYCIYDDGKRITCYTVADLTFAEVRNLVRSMINRMARDTSCAAQSF